VRSTLTLVLAAVVLPGGAQAATLSHPAGGRPQLDVRAGERAPIPAATRAARTALAEHLGIESQVATDPVGGGLRALGRTDGFLSGPGAGDPAAIALDYVRAHASVFGLSAADLASLRLVARYRSEDGVTHLTWLETSRGIDAYDSELSVHVAADGSVVAASGPPLGGLALASAAPRISASQALSVVKHDLGAPMTFPAAHAHPGAARRTSFTNGDEAHLVGFASPSGDRLAWRLTVAGQGPYLYDEVVDAATGAVLARHSLTDFASAAHVFFYHPGAATGGTAQAVDLAQWLPSPPGSTLSGPNAHAYADVNDDGNGTDGAPVEIPPSSGTNWDYPQTSVPAGGGQFCSTFSGICTWSGTSAATEATNRAQVTTQLFYFVNNYHDWLEQPAIGFDDASHNFQVGGTGGDDPVNAESDDSIDAAQPNLNNANMSTPPDGQSPRMQMYLFNSPFPAVNGGDDASVVYHEYTHGLSNRLVNNGLGGGLDGNQPGAMGEAWSDWYAMDYLVANGFVTDTGTDGQVVVGEYATGDGVHGIRTQPLDCSVGSSAPACAGTATTAGGGYTYADLGHVGSYDASHPRFEVHDDGEIWGETLWDLRTALGAATARRLITDAMRLSPVDPSFLDERDAILEADVVDDGGAHHDQLWQLFAARGMGFGARTTSFNATRGVPSFATPALAAVAATSLDDSAPFGDGDQVAEPGESPQLAMTLGDPGLANLTHVHATLTTATPGVFIGQADADYGTIAAGTLGAPATPFTFSLPSALACGAQVPFTLHVTSDQGAIDLPVVVSLGAGSSVFSSSDGSHPIPDGNPTSTTGTSTITVPTDGRIDDLRVTVNISQTFVGDLTAQLTSPTGTKIDLLERPGFGQFGSDLHWAGPVTFDDAAVASIQEIGDLPGSPLSGSFVPDEPLSTFAGQDRAGTWTLRVTDAATPDGGTLNGWSLDTDQPSCSTSALPAPTTGAASNVTSSSAQLNGTIDPGGRPAHVAFQYGTTASYGQSSAPQSLNGSEGSIPTSATVAGLAQQTTYHYRLVAFAGSTSGPLVALGADQTLTTAGPAAAGGGGGGGVRKTVKASVSHRTTRATLDRHSRFAFAFRAAPAGLKGTLRIVLPKHGRTKALLLGSARFTTTRSGRVRLVLTLRGAALKRLRALHAAKVAVTIAFGGRTFGSTLRLASPAPLRRKR
jgi:subtilisin-like proprotein convertase family protein